VFITGNILSSHNCRYSNNPNAALRAFNHCRRDSEWKEKALCHMIEIFLNPDNQTLGADAMNEASDVGESDNKSESELVALLTADKLIKELDQNLSTLKAQVYECYAIMASKTKQDVEKGMTSIIQVLNQDREYMPALLVNTIYSTHCLLEGISNCIYVTKTNTQSEKSIKENCKDGV
jgi:hypothetical protein